MSNQSTIVWVNLAIGTVIIRFGMKPVFRLVDMIVADVGEAVRRHWPFPGKIVMGPGGPFAKALPPTTPAGAIERANGDA